MLTDPHIRRRYPELTAPKILIALRQLRFVSDYFRQLKVSFKYPRDPKDEKFIELAIAGHATHLISGDDDLLSLPHGHGDAARRLRQRAPNLKIMDAKAFLRELEQSQNL